MHLEVAVSALACSCAGEIPPWCMLQSADVIDLQSFADVWNDAENPGTVTSALIDMALLSHCDDIVLTMASSFGYVAAAWAGYAPVYMVYGEHMSSQNPYWYR